MGGGLLQLVAYGSQDIYLTGNPQITYFKVVYRRNTNFATESINNLLNNNPKLGKKVSSTISRNGDLLNNIILEIILINYFEYTFLNKLIYLNNLSIYFILILKIDY